MRKDEEDFDEEETEDTDEEEDVETEKKSRKAVRPSIESQETVRVVSQGEMLNLIYQQNEVILKLLRGSN